MAECSAGREAGDLEKADAPSAEDLFEVEADPTVRIRFVGHGVGQAVKLIAIHSDGSIDEWARRIRFVGHGVGQAVKLIAIHSDGSIDEWARS